MGSGDPANKEAHGARLYWSCWLPGKEKFKRDPDGLSPNHFLNYGYLVLRAAVARAICGAGLNPALGLHHGSRSNGFALADDLLEPFRPWVDLQSRDLYREEATELNRTSKARLAGILYEDCICGGQKTTIGSAIEKQVNSLVRCFENNGSQLDVPLPLGWSINEGTKKKTATTSSMKQDSLPLDGSDNE